MALRRYATHQAAVSLQTGTRPPQRRAVLRGHQPHYIRVGLERRAAVREHVNLRREMIDRTQLHKKTRAIAIIYS
jgi:hypothetical protein